MNLALSNSAYGPKDEGAGGTIANTGSGVIQASRELTELSEEAESKATELKVWCRQFSGYSGVDMIEEKVSVCNDGLHIKTGSGTKVLAWKGETSLVSTGGKIDSDQVHSIMSIVAILEALGEIDYNALKKLRTPFSPIKIGSGIASLFFQNIANCENGELYLTSSRTGGAFDIPLLIKFSAEGIFITYEMEATEGPILAKMNS